MSSYDDRDGGDPQPKRMIYETRQEAKEMRKICWQQLINYGQLERALHLQLVQTVLEYNQTLREFDEEGVVEPGDYPNLDKLKHAVGRQSRNIVTTGGQWSDSTQIKTQPMALEFPARQLIRVLNRLDRLAGKLGFSAETPKHTEVFGVDPDWEADDDNGGESDADSPTPE